MSGSTATTTGALLQWRARETPLSTAFRWESAPLQWQSISWGDFAARTAALAQALAGAGLRRGDRFALIAPVSLEWELLHHAALTIGVAIVALDGHDLPQRLAGMAALAEVRAFAVADCAVLSAMNVDLLSGAAFVLQLGGAAGVVASGDKHVHMLDWKGLVALAKDAPVPDPALPQDMATVIFTSGTTGTPKGIPYTHAQLCLAIDAICDAFAFTDNNSRLLCWLPLSNLFQRIVNLAGVRQGAVTSLLADPRRVMDVVADVAPDIFISVPRFYEKLYDGLRDNIARQPPLRRWLVQLAWQFGRQVQQHRRAGGAVPPLLALQHSLADKLVLSRLRAVMGHRLHCMVTGSAPCPSFLLEEFAALGWLLLEAYGLSENVVPMALNTIDACRPGTVGKPVVGNHITIAADGQVLVRGPGVFTGYLGEMPGARLDVDGFYATGDLGAIDADGYLRLTGRNGDLIKTSTGRRIAPVGVEAQLRSVPGVDQAMLVGAGRKGVVALCTTAMPLDSANRQQLKSDLHAKMPHISEHERPMAVALLERPFNIERGELTPNLKLRRAAIEAAYAPLIEQLYAAAEATGGGSLAVLP